MGLAIQHILGTSLISNQKNTKQTNKRNKTKQKKLLTQHRLEQAEQCVQPSTDACSPFRYQMSAGDCTVYSICEEKNMYIVDVHTKGEKIILL